MQLRKVEVRGIRSYEHARLDLSGGTTLLVGDVGSGKTSLLYAVEMALFGAAEIDATFLVRHGASESMVSVALEDEGHTYEIERTFRRVRRKGRETLESGRLSFRKDGAATSYSATELRQQVISLLGFRDNPNPRAHSDLWRWAVYVPQEQMRKILAASPGERLETVRKALGVERYRRAAENAKEVARDLRQSAAALRAQDSTLREFAEDLERAVLEAARLAAEREQVEASLRRVEESLGPLRERTTRAEGQLQQLDAARTRLAEVGRDAAREVRRTEEAERREEERRHEAGRAAAEVEELAARAGQEAARRAALEEAEHEVAERRQEVERRSVAAATWTSAEALRASREAELARQRQDHERLEAELVRTQQALSEVEDPRRIEAPVPPTPLTVAEWDVRIAEGRRIEQAATDAVALARHGLHELHELIAGGVCPRCHQSVRSADFASHEHEARAVLSRTEQTARTATSERELLESLRQRRESFERELAAWGSRAARLRDLSEGISRGRRTLEQNESRLQLAAQALSEAVREVEVLTEPAQGLRPARELLGESERRAESGRTALEEAHRAAERQTALTERIRVLRVDGERAARESAEASARCDERERETEDLKDRLSSEEEVRREARSARTELDAREGERHRFAEERGRLTGLGEAAGARQRRAEAARVERDRLAHEAATVDAQAAWLATAFHDAVLIMEQRVLERAQAEFEQTFRSYFAALMDDPDLVAVTDSTFSPAAEIRGVETPAEALSGGERTSLALAYRLALSKVVRSLGGLRFDCLLLDEPTDGFSPEQVQSMGQLLEELHLPQVLLVSHERELEAVADRVVRVEKQDGVSVLRTSAAPVEPAAPTGDPPT